ncbi:thioredoxin domain-containing protein [Candidatus Daviesbacteria bacterium]|nr:thioredoxin domain-containing protein [Candidatus Daviesbacteria bacterium]
MDKTSSFLTLPMSILLGAALISVTILMHGGIIKLGRPVSTSGSPPPAAAQPAQPSQAKTEADIVKNLKSQAQKLGLDTNKFNSCLDSGSQATKVAQDLNDGSKAGVTGTPAFFVNGRLIAGAVPFDQFKTVIEEELGGSAASTVQRVTVGNGDLPILGQPSAKVTLIEFSDYQCPFCSRHFTQVEGQLKKEYIDSGKVKFYYRDFPLSQIHPGAQKAAEAARCAGDQNKYWEYHDLVFQNQTSIF